MSQNNGDFIAELRSKKEELSQVINSKKLEVARFESDQRKLSAVIESEKHSSNGKKHHGANKETRSDIQKNEAKFKEQAQKLDVLKKELRHLEDELKSVNHDLHVVGL